MSNTTVSSTDGNMATSTTKRTTGDSPGDLIDATVFNINSDDRKFLIIGLDPTNHFEVIVQIISASQQIVFSPDFLRRIFSVMDHIIPAILDVSSKTKTKVFVSNDTVKLCKIVYRGQNKLSFQLKADRERRVLLDSKDVIALRYMEWSTFENIVLKSSISKPIVVAQVNDIVDYMKKTFPRGNSVEEMISVIESVTIDILSANSPKNRACFTSQLKHFAVKHIAEKWFAAQDTSSEVIKESTYSLL